MKKKKHKEEVYLPKPPSSYEDNSTGEEKQKMQDLHKKYDNKNSEIPELSQREKEHLTYLMVMDCYNEAKIKRTNARRYGSLFIIISGSIFLTLMFSLEAKIELLCIWIATILYCVSVMLKADYRYQNFKEILGVADENDYYGMDDDDPPQQIPEKSEPEKAENTDTKE